MSYLFINLSSKASLAFEIQLNLSAQSTKPFSGRVIYSRTQLFSFNEDFDTQINFSCMKGQLITSTKLHWWEKKNRERNTDCVQSKYLKWVLPNCHKHVGYSALHDMAWMVE